MPREDAQSANAGLLALRIGIGGMFFLGYGAGKIFGGPDTWAAVGALGMSLFGIHFAPVAWGFAAAFSEFVGGVMIALGLLTRPFALLIAVTMGVAFLSQATAAGAFSDPSKIPGLLHPLGHFFVMISLMLAGPGRFSLSQAIPALRGKWLS